MYVWGVNSTVTKHSDCFVWKDMLERVAWRCDDTVDRKRMNSCQLKHLFGRELSNPKNRTKKLEILSRRAANVTFSWFGGWRRPKKTARFFETALRAVLLDPLVQMNSGPKILRSCFLYWCLSVFHVSEIRAGAAPSPLVFCFWFVMLPHRQHSKYNGNPYKWCALIR